jgi:hypothetical protein
MVGDLAEVIESSLAVPVRVRDPKTVVDGSSF